MPALRHCRLSWRCLSAYISGVASDPNDKDAVTSPETGKKPDNPAATPTPGAPRPREIGGPKGPDPTRYGDWEVGGRCIDF